MTSLSATINFCTQDAQCQTYMGVSLGCAGLALLFAIFGLGTCCGQSTKEAGVHWVVVPAILTEILLAIQLLVNFLYDFPFGKDPIPFSGVGWASTQVVIGVTLCLSLANLLGYLFPSGAIIYKILLIAGFIAYAGAVVPLFLGIHSIFMDGFYVFFGLIAFASFDFMFVGMILLTKMISALAMHDQGGDSLIPGLRNLRAIMLLSMTPYVITSILFLLEFLRKVNLQQFEFLRKVNLQQFYILYLFFMLPPIVLSFALVSFANVVSSAASAFDTAFTRMVINQEV